MAEENLSLRERKKRRTRRELIEISQRLFRTKGFNETTLEDICAEAEVSVPTLLTYFESKAQLALARDWESYEVLKSRIEDPERAEDTVSIWQEFTVGGAEYTARNRREELEWHLSALMTDGMRREALTILEAFVDVLREGLAADAAERTALDNRLLATMLVYGQNAALLQWVEEGGKGDLAARTADLIEFAVRQFGSAS